jgi:G2/mitotic-specific cyclin 2
MRVSKADEDDVKAQVIAKFLLEVGCLEWRLLSPPPSLMAATSDSCSSFFTTAPG